MKQYIAENASPNPKSTINSYRSFGYSLSTAISDIIDNSISANADQIQIRYIWAGNHSFISILDNGSGMTLSELVTAMTPGSKDPEEVRMEKDLGRFGMGLKTASFSQCKRLTVATKKNGEINKRCWDIDFINETQQWTLLNFISDDSFLKELEPIENGTLILWEKLDRLVGSADIENETVKNAFYQEFATVREHISMVFHRFLDRKSIRIFINSTEINPWNPFLLNLNPKPEVGPTEIINDKAEVTYYILPHMSRISHEDYRMSGGPLGWYQQQGFYVYRGDRLLVAGDWLGLEKKREYSKLARVSINFSNSKDFDWNLDIKKSTATPPVEVRRDLERIAKLACNKSAKIYNWRGQKDISTSYENHSIQRLWAEELTRDGTKKYRINRKHELIKRALEQDDNSKKLFSKALKLIEENLPIELILYNQNEDPSYHELEKPTDIPTQSLIELAIELFKMNIEQGVPLELAAQQIMHTTPFNKYPLINDYLK